MTSTLLIHGLSLLTPNQEARWSTLFSELGYAIDWHSIFDEDSNHQQSSCFTLLQATQFSEVSRTLKGCIHFPPLCVVLETEPSAEEKEILRRMGTACVLTGEPNRDMARQILNNLGQSLTWFKGVGQWAHLPDVLQFVASGGRSVLVTVSGNHSRLIDDQTPWEKLKFLEEDEESAWYGRIYVENGMVVHAEIPEGQTGDQAVAVMLKLHDGVVRVLDCFLPPPRIDSPRSIQGCLLNAAYLLDESERSDSLNESLSESMNFGDFSMPIPLDSSLETPLASLHAQPEAAPAPVATPTVNSRAKFDALAKESELTTLLQASRDGQLIYSKSAPEECDILAAVASECQRLIEQIAQKFGSTHAKSWDFSTEEACFYCSETDKGDLVIAADVVTKSPHTILRQIENIAHSLSED